MHKSVCFYVKDYNVENLLTLAVRNMINEIKRVFKKQMPGIWECFLFSLQTSNGFGYRRAGEADE